MTVPQPFQYQGSKRLLAAAILRHLPAACGRLVEPFAGSGALSIAGAAGGRARTFWLNDLNKPLAGLVDLVIHDPGHLGDFYQDTWRGEPAEALDHYYQVREDFNRDQDPRLLLYLLARCVKGAVRYNSDGGFNQSPDKRRLGTLPATMRRNILAVSMLMRGRTAVTSADYREVLADVTTSDIVYMDPPYQGVCGERDSRYLAGISFDEFVAALARLNDRGIRYLISYDGRLGSRVYGEPLPSCLDLTSVEIEAGRSAQATLLGRDDVTIESLYFSKTLAPPPIPLARPRHSPASRSPQTHRDGCRSQQC